MKATLRATFAIAVFTLLIPVAASAQDGKLNLSFLDRLAERATEKQEVTLDEQMEVVPLNTELHDAEVLAPGRGERGWSRHRLRASA